MLQMQTWGVCRLRSYYKRIWFIQQSLLRFLWVLPDDMTDKWTLNLWFCLLQFVSDLAVYASLYIKNTLKSYHFFLCLQCVLIAWHFFSSNTWAMSLSYHLCYFSLYQLKSSLILLMHLKSTFLFNILLCIIFSFYQTTPIFQTSMRGVFLCCLHYFWLSFAVLFQPSIISQLKVSPKAKHVFLTSQQKNSYVEICVNKSGKNAINIQLASQTFMYFHSTLWQWHTMNLSMKHFWS